MPPPFHWTSVTFETRYRHLLPRQLKAKLWAQLEPFTCGWHYLHSVLRVSPLDSSDPFLLPYMSIINVPQRMSFYVLPNMLGTLTPHLASMPGITAPRLSSPFPNIRIAFEFKEEIKGKSLLIWGNLTGSFKLNFKREKQVVSLEFFFN